MAPQATTTEGPNIKGDSWSEQTRNAYQSESRVIDALNNPNFSLSPNASPEFKSRINDLTKRFAHTIADSFRAADAGLEQSAPFSATRDGETVHLMYPTAVKEGDLLAGIITALASMLPRVVLYESTNGWSEPEWSAESRKHLAGIASGLQQVPQSFAHSSQPTDLARICLWINTCSSALSVPGGVKDAQGDVLPSTVGGQKSAAKYMSRIMAGLRSSITDDAMLKSIETLSMLLKLWQKENHAKALSIVRNCKLSWSSVLFRAAPTDTIKGKKGKPDQRVIRSPSKPSKSPWLTPAERSELGNLLKDDWSFLEGFRDSWALLSSQEQHKQFSSYIRQIKDKYSELKTISDSIHAKLGKRKYWIQRQCKIDNFKPKPKKGESDSFLLSAHFFSKDLSGTKMGIKKIFSPVTYLDNKKYGTDDAWASLVNTTSEVLRLSSATCTVSQFGPATPLWKIWSDIFKPVFKANETQNEDAPQLEDFNMYTVLEAKKPST
jgi:hypothetical protein